MDFKYKAINQNNDVIEGIESAESKFDLSNFLKTQGLILIDAEETTKKKSFFSLSFSLSIRGISTPNKIAFARNIGAMLGAGLSLTRALAVMEKQSTNKKMKKMVSDVNLKIKKGSPLSDALADQPKVFDKLFISMTKAGEESGNLVESMNEVSNQMEKNYLLKKKIKGAMIYPAVIVSAMLIIGIFMMVYIVPTLTQTFEDVGAELPQSTLFIIGLSDFFVENTLITIISLFVLLFIIYIMVKTKEGKRIFDTVILKIPFVSGLVKETNSARTARTLASLLKSGVPYLTSIKITKETLSNMYFVRTLEEAEKKVEMGLTISKVFEENQKYYPPFVSEMISVGEETGEISQMLFKVAEFYENEIDQKTKNLSTIVEPVLMIFVGFAVGFFAISMISPMYSLVENF
jgi:type IV pilus assembly protein PilC